MRSNPTPHSDAREAPCQFKRPSARAGGRERWASPVTAVPHMTKPDALKFLEHVHHSLEQQLPSSELLRSHVRDTASSAKRDADKPHMRRPEEAFLNGFVIPHLFTELQVRLSLSPARARAALLSENYRHMSTMCSGTPARKDRHPFDKTLAPNSGAVMAHWRSGKANALRQSCPDFALRDPCPYSVVFEGKYFEAGSASRAEADLVSNIYQAFFYRALPKIAGTALRPAWNYEFACLLACDASRDGTLKRAWDSLPREVRDGFWKGANVYVMVLRGKA